MLQLQTRFYLLGTIRKNISIIKVLNSKNFSTDGPSDPDTPKFDMKNPFDKERKLCILCKHNITPDYKNVRLLSQFQSPFTGRIYGKHISGLCDHKQKQVESEILKAQNAGLMPYYLKDINFVKDPKLFNPENPIKPHRF